MYLNNTSTAFVFPGQGSQKIEMGKELAQAYAKAREIFEKSDELLGVPLTQILWEGPEKELNDTLNTQPALFIHSIAALTVFQELFPQFTPKFVAGHSMGELTALTASGAVPFDDGLKLVRKRGELMKRAGEISPGSMAAILGLDIPSVEKICLDASKPGDAVQLANDNCPGQVVVSGTKSAVERILPMAKEAGAKRALPLAVSIAAHSVLMEDAQDDFAKAVNETTIKSPKITTIGNVTARPLNNKNDIQTDLESQLTSRVRWTESIEYMIENGVDTFIEFGSKEVLNGLIKRIDRGTKRISIGTPEDFEKLAN